MPNIPKGATHAKYSKHRIIPTAYFKLARGGKLLRYYGGRLGWSNTVYEVSDPEIVVIDLGLLMDNFLEKYNANVA